MVAVRGEEGVAAGDGEVEEGGGGVDLGRVEGQKEKKNVDNNGINEEHVTVVPGSSTISSSSPPAAFLSYCAGPRASFHRGRAAAEDWTTGKEEERW